MTSKKEFSSLPEADTQIIQLFARSFIHRLDYYPIQLKDGSYATLKGPLIPNLIAGHFRGTVTLGAYALDVQSISRWLCLDADQEEEFALLKTIAYDLESKSIKSYLEQSRRGGHLWLFTPPLPGKIVREFGRRLFAPYGLPKLEMYPKQDVLTTGVGSLVRLPLGIHRKSGKRYHFITPTGEPLAPTIRQQITLLASPTRITQEFIDQILAQTDIPRPPPPPKPEILRFTGASEEPVSDRLKKAISVYDFVSHYVDLDEHGKGLCPFHDDQHQSFQVNIEGNYWNCYAGCGGGSLIDFWMKWREVKGQNGSFTATVKDLAGMLL